MRVPADPTAQWRVVLMSDRARDPAISADNNVEALVEYMLTRDPEAIGREITLEPDQQPTWYTLAPLTLAAVSELLSRETAVERQRELACRLALVAIEGPSGEGVDTRNREPSLGKMNALAREELDRLYQRIGYDGIAELGDIAIVRARLRPGRRGPFGLCQS